jgi:hypothetical protein
MYHLTKKGSKSRNPIKKTGEFGFLSDPKIGIRNTNSPEQQLSNKSRLNHLAEMILLPST